MSLVHEAGASLISNFTVPYKGTWNSVAANMLSPDALYDSMNVFIRKGKIRERPGLLSLNPTIFDRAVLGSVMAVTPTDKIMLAITRTQVYTLSQSDTTWQSDSVGSYADENAPIDITFIETNNQHVAIIASKGFVLSRWIQGAGVTHITPTLGIIPFAKSVCTSAHRIIALVDPHTIRWSATLTYDEWPALAIAKIAQSNDDAICIRALGTLNFVIYKERSIYIANAQAGSDASAFNIRFMQTVEGPAGVHAVVVSNGTHVYMTKNGRVGVFDGSGFVKWVCDGLWIHLQGDIDPIYAHSIFGVFDYRLHTVTFYYPKRGDSGLIKGMLLINLPLEGSGIETQAAFLGVSQIPVSYGTEMRFNNNIDRSIIYGVDDGVGSSYIFDEEVRSDNNTPYQCAIQTGLFPLPNMQHHHVSVETFLERSDGNGFVMMSGVTSDALENETGTTSTLGQVIDLNHNPVREYFGFDVQSRFFGLKYTWLSDSKVRYAGASLYGRAVG